MRWAYRSEGWYRSLMSESDDTQLPAELVESIEDARRHPERRRQRVSRDSDDDWREEYRLMNPGAH